MNKKAISVLVSTLMLISIMTIVAIMIVTFSETFTKNTLSGAATTTEEQLVCMQEVVVDFNKLCYFDNNKFNAYIVSNGVRDIESLKLRVYTKENNVKVFDLDSLKKFMVNDYNLEWSGMAGKITYAEVIPAINYQNNIKYCSNAKVSFGFMKGKTIDKCS
ncbi:hypothetical protein D6777_02030 [Candidatus Woesearchaeota archaeon]|nr:MAG: hypothetical protein D6777_02030 [Candidatus Woesearchaeota archaeon]